VLAGSIARALTKWVARRRVGVAVGASLLLHVLLVLGVRGRTPAAPGDAPDRAEMPVAFAPVGQAVPPAPMRVVVVGPRVSGHGRTQAGNDPQHAGSPLRASRTQWARGRSDGPGGAGQAGQRVPPPVAPTADAPLPTVTAAPAPHDAMPVPAAAVKAESRDDPPRAPGAPSVAGPRSLDELVREQHLRLARGDLGGEAGWGLGNGGVGVGLGTEISGRHVEKSRVASPPVVTAEHQVECELPRLTQLETVVRLLVTRDGVAMLPRFLRSSGHADFDACALRYVRAMSFAPGVDAEGRPLDVWIHVRVAPTTAARLGGVVR